MTRTNLDMIISIWLLNLILVFKPGMTSADKIKALVLAETHAKRAVVIGIISILGNPGLQRGWGGKGETGSRKKVGGGEGKGNRKGEALGSFSIQIISR